jgi:2-oxoglutarate dehydrogenase complex dehydrogenase (E1) component-like enzyme
MKAAFQAHLNDEFEAGRSFRPNKADWLDGRWSHLAPNSGRYERGRTAISEALFREVGAALTRLPDGFVAHAPCPACWRPSARCSTRAPASTGPPPRRSPSARC